ncbi:DUF418 domain-containing protein [Lunatimonas salinarum]|uniref:DUF418 domain-containing protein n=1 Tax=Lunatimonas salinarum TaxID=1774590 RepID=UPI001AE0408E
MVFDVMQSLGYILLIFSPVQYSKLSKLFVLVSFAGRMALTNYLMQTIVGIFLFTFLGLGLFGTLAPSRLLLLCVVVFGLQVYASRGYLKVYKQGPMESLWRKLI